jgi:hypothetical protein
MCEKCAATEGTFREVGVIRQCDVIHRHRDEIVYVVSAGDCLLTPNGIAPVAASLGSCIGSWCSELLGSNGLSYPTASWVLEFTSPASDMHTNGSSHTLSSPDDAAGSGAVLRGRHDR